MRHHRTTGGFQATRRGARRWRLPGRIASLAVSLALLAAAALVLLLARGPLDLAEAVPRMEAMANDALGDAAAGVTVAIGGARFGLGPRAAPAPGVYLDHLRLIDADGTVIAEAPTVRIGFRPLELLAGRLRLSHVTVLGASLSLRQPVDGALVGDLAPLDPAAADAPPVAALLARLAAAPPPLLESLSDITFRDMAVTLDLATAAMTLPLRGVTVRFALHNGALAASASVPLGEGLPPLAVTAALARDGAVRLDASVAALPAAHWQGAISHLDIVDLPLSADIAMDLAADGRLEAASATVTAGRGVVTLPGYTLNVEAARLRLRLDDGALAVDDLTLDAGPVALSAQGRVGMSMDDRAVVADLTLGPTSLPLDPRGERGAVARFQAGALSVRLQRDPWRLEIAEARLTRGALAVGLSGTVADGPEGWLLALDGAVRGLAVPDLLALWPRTVAPGALRWMRTHLEAGHVDMAAFSVDGPLTSPRAALDFAFRDARATPLPPLPPITEARGWGRVDTAAFTLGLAEGRVEIPGLPDGAIDLRGSTFHLEPIGIDRTPAAIAVRGEGPVSAILTLIGSPPLSLLDRVAITPEAVGGRARVAADLRVPLVRDLALADIGVAVSATVTDARLDLDVPLGPFRAPAMVLEADTERLRLAGEGLIGQSAVAVQWDEVFAPRADTPRTTLAVSMEAEPGDLAAFGLDPRSIGPGVDLRIRGPVPTRLRLRRDGGGLAPGTTGFETTLDLRTVALDAPLLGVAKPMRAAASARIDGVAGPSGIELSTVHLDAADIRLRGRAQLDAGGTLVRVDIDTLQLGDNTDLAAVVTRQGRGFDATLRGRSMDVSGLIGAERAGGERTAPTGPPVDMRLLLDRLVLTPSLAVTAARGDLRRKADGTVSVVLNATGPADGPLAVQIDQDASGLGTVRASSRDVGALAREAGLFARALGGQLDLSARLLDRGAVDGEARITDVIVSDDPRLDTLLEGADLDGALERLRAEGIRFDTMRVPFRWASGTLTLREAVAYGPVIGISLSGTYAPATDELAMAGVFTPLYGLNSLIGNLPLIGRLLTGGDGQGLLAFTFDLAGPAADPRVSVNPFSVLLPGVLRQILQPGPGGDASPDPG